MCFALSLAVLGLCLEELGLAIYRHEICSHELEVRARELVTLSSSRQRTCHFVKFGPAKWVVVHFAAADLVLT